MTDSKAQSEQPKRSRSFSLLTFLLISGVVALSIAIYSANKEVAETRAKMAKQSNEMGYIEDVDETKLHVRRLGGYPQMTFAFRYQLPKDKDYMLHIGSGIIDPETDLPDRVLYRKQLNQGESQGMLIVSLVEMPTPTGVRWVIEVIDGNSMQRTYCAPREFDWLQGYLAAFPTNDQVGNHMRFFTNEPAKVLGHGSVAEFEPYETAKIYSKSEFHPSAIDSLPPELLKNRKTFRIWLEAAKDKEVEFESGSWQTRIDGSGEKFRLHE